MSVAPDAAAPAQGDRRPTHRPTMAFVAVAVGWLALVFAIGVVLPMFGVISPVSVAATGIGWLWVIGVPTVMAVVWLRRRHRFAAIAMAVLAAWAGVGLAVLRPPMVSPETHFQLHRGDLAALAADYRAGSVTEAMRLPLSMRMLSIDGLAHVRCGDGHCGLYLAAWQDWRAESGVGFVYYPTTPPPGMQVVTATGDMGVVTRELGDGWWWVE